MAAEKQNQRCPECAGEVNRREFIATVGGAAVAAGSMPLLAGARPALGAPTQKSSAETAAKRLYDSLTDAQKKVVVMPWNDKRRTNISANWRITKATIGEFFSKEQQEIINDVVRGVTSEDGFERLNQQMDEDWGGIGEYSVGLFGEPGSDQFEFELTGRHLTLRADGNTVENAAFGGPIVYGHGVGGASKENLFWYQSKRANEVFAMLDGKQREKALLDKAPKENQVPVQGAKGSFPGIGGSELSADQRELISQVLADILAPYRKEDVDEALELMKAGGGLEKMHIAFYQSGDIGGDGFWDVWRLESPSVVCHFRGKPHVHAYINIAKQG